MRLRPLLPFPAAVLCVATATFGLALSGCGNDDSAPMAAEPARTAAQDAPPPALAPGVLGSIADVAPARARIGYVNPQALAKLDAPLPAAEISALVLGPAGAARLERSPDPRPKAVVQAGPATVLVTDAGRTAAGAGTELRSSLEAQRPAESLITAETPSAVQSCLGDAAAEVIVGPAVLGRMSAIGVGLTSSQDAPAGPKLLICAAPHLARDLHAIEDRLTARFPAEGARAGQAPVVAEQEIGEREIVAAAIALDAVDRALLRELLAGGPALRRLALG